MISSIRTTNDSELTTQPTLGQKRLHQDNSRDTGTIDWLPVRFITYAYQNFCYIAGEVSEYLSRGPKPIGQRHIKTVFVGAGPVGLWGAIQHKLNNPEADIEMFDKYSEYKRTHTVRLDIGSFSGAKMTPGLVALKKKIKENRGRIACHELENSLLKVAENLNISVNNYGAEVVKVGSSSIKLKNGETVHFDQLVGADGAHSKMRKAILGSNEDVNLSELSDTDQNNEFSLRREMQHRVRVRYKVNGSSCPLGKSWRNWFRAAYPAAKVIGSQVDEHISKPDEQGNCMVTMDFFINKKEYEQLFDAGFRLKNAAKLPMVKKSLQNKICLLQDLKASMGESRVIGSEEITPYALSYFQARKVAHTTRDNKAIFLAGDSATALPYFRSLNNGLICATKLGVTLARNDKRPDHMSSHQSNYENYVHLRARREFAVARIKDRAINLLNWGLRFVNRLPFQIISLHPEQIKKYI